MKHKNSRKQELALRHYVNRLVIKVITCGKVHIKHIRIVTKQAWSIKITDTFGTYQSCITADRAYR